MTSRAIPYDRNAVCDECGHVGAYDFMGDLLCEKCADKYIGNESGAAQQADKEQPK